MKATLFIALVAITIIARLTWEIGELQNTADRSLDTLSFLAEQTCLNEDQKRIYRFSEIPEREKAELLQLSERIIPNCERE